MQINRDLHTHFRGFLGLHFLLHCFFFLPLLFDVKDKLPALAGSLNKLLHLHLEHTAVWERMKNFLLAGWLLSSRLTGNMCVYECTLPDCDSNEVFMTDIVCCAFNWASDVAANRCCFPFYPNLLL